jgi:TRAP transporter TAXI family solute receptor
VSSFKHAFKSVIGAALLSLCITTVQAQMVTIATNPQGTFFYAVGAAIAQVVQQKSNVVMTVKPMSGSSAYAPLVNRGDIDFGLSTSIDVVNAYTGVEGYRKNPNLRVIGAMFILPLAIGVANDNPAKSIKDLKGMRIASQFTAQKANKANTDALLATAGLTMADMKEFPVSDYGKGMAAVGEGKADASVFCVGCAAASEASVSLASHGGVRFLPLSDTPATLAAIRKVLPSAYTKVFPASSATPGVNVPTRLMVYSVMLEASAHVSDETAYKVTKALHDNKEALAASAAVLKTFDPTMMAEANIVPYHPGAIKFYTEVGLWPPKAK